ncbi:unnamed protein product [Rangifer tarandus platyrhynchus]|uniref:Uncharacterized protein n=1 Tax=Rangifer tarandus platyrhynchus TaxID=3082113 RepID=A0AC59Y0L9_RANTA
MADFSVSKVCYQRVQATLYYQWDYRPIRAFAREPVTQSVRGSSASTPANPDPEVRLHPAQIPEPARSQPRASRPARSCPSSLCPSA